MSRSPFCQKSVVQPLDVGIFGKMKPALRNVHSQVAPLVASMTKPVMVSSARTKNTNSRTGLPSFDVYTQKKNMSFKCCFNNFYFHFTNF